MNKDMIVKIKNFGIKVCQFSVKLTLNVLCAVLYTCNVVGYVAPVENFRDKIVTYLGNFIS